MMFNSARAGWARLFKKLRLLFENVQPVVLAPLLVDGSPFMLERLIEAERARVASLPST
jgi:hypothetical protein